MTRCDHYTNGDGIGAFVLPATHAACTNSGTLNIMGMRIRLKASFDISAYSPVNQIILTAMKKYGLILADNGSSLYFQGTPDTRWNDDDLSSLESIAGSDFEVIQMPQIYTNESHPTWRGTCDQRAHRDFFNDYRGAERDASYSASERSASYNYIDNAGFMRNASDDGDADTDRLPTR